MAYRSSSKLGSGLGTTGSLNVALLAAIDAANSPPVEIAERAYQFETLLGNKGGRQDQWLAALGGFRHICFSERGVETQDFEPTYEMRKWLKEHLLLFDSGICHTSGELHDSVWRRLEHGEECCLDESWSVLSESS